MLGLHGGRVLTWWVWGLPSMITHGFDPHCCKIRNKRKTNKQTNKEKPTTTKTKDIYLISSLRENLLSMWHSCMSCWYVKEWERWPAPTLAGSDQEPISVTPGLASWRVEGNKSSGERGRSSFPPGFSLKKFWKIHVLQTHQLSSRNCCP